jgi:alpha-tubulin suppressor-like RCC1 family protein
MTRANNLLSAAGVRVAIALLVGLFASAALHPAGTRAELASSNAHRAASGRLATGARFSCAIVDGGAVRCWGVNDSGQLGYGNSHSVGNDELPASAGPVDLGPGRTAVAIAAGFYHACAIVDDGSVRCWGYGGNGALGYGNIHTVGDDETPASAGPVDLGPDRTAVAITAGGRHTCALLDNGKVHCWGLNSRGQLGLGNTKTIGDNETPASVAPVNLGKGRKAVAIAGGGYHTCAILDNGKVRCWGYNNLGQLGLADKATIGDNETPASVAPVKLGEGRKAVAITAGLYHTCAILGNGRVRCWGIGSSGRLGYGNTRTIGDNETPASVRPVKLGKRRKAVAISASGEHTCAVVDGGTLRCWGTSKFGQLGYGHMRDIGDNESPASVRPVKLGKERKAVAVTAGGRHTCALLDNGSLRCWGLGANGQLGYGNTRNIGDNESPASAGPLDLGAKVATG